MAHVINVRITPDVEQIIRRAMREHGLTRSQVVRTYLRRGLGISGSPFQAGFFEGYKAGESAFLAEMNAKSPGKTRK